MKFWRNNWPLVAVTSDHQNDEKIIYCRNEMKAELTEKCYDMKFWTK